jgi:hypothetical protein
MSRVRHEHDERKRRAVATASGGASRRSERRLDRTRRRPGARCPSLLGRAHASVDPARASGERSASPDGLSLPPGVPCCTASTTGGMRREGWTSMLASAYGQAVPKTASAATQNQSTETCGERRKETLRPLRWRGVRRDAGDAALEHISLSSQRPGRDTPRPAYAIGLAQYCQRQQPVPAQPSCHVRRSSSKASTEAATNLTGLYPSSFRATYTRATCGRSRDD